MSAPTRGAQQHWADVTAAVDAAVRELPQRSMHLDPRLEALQRREEPPGSEATRAGLVLAGDWSAPACARAATSHACTAAGLPPAVAAAASVVALRTVSSAVVAGARTITVKVTASGAGACTSVRARFAAPPGLDGQKGTSAARANPWQLGSATGRATGRGSTEPHDQGRARLFGVAVDAFGVLQDRADVVVWFEVRRVVP